MCKRILIGSCGGLTGSYLTRQFKKKNCIVIGADANKYNATKHFTDDFVLLPNAADESFFSELLLQLKAKQIDCYVPTHSKEIKKIAELEHDLRRLWQGAFIVSPYETFKKLDDKKSANKYLSKIKIPVPKIIESADNCDSYPIFMKPNTGSGSSKAHPVESRELHREYAKLYPASSFYEMISGKEYTVDCMFDANGKLLAYNSRTRLKSMGGAVIITQNSRDFDILSYLKKIESAYTLKGCVNFQYILSKNIPYFIDVNLRYASGGLPLTVASGVDVCQILLDLWAGKEVQPRLALRADKKTMYRYFEEFFEDN